MMRASVRRLPIIGGIIIILLVLSACSGSDWSDEETDEVESLVESFPVSGFVSDGVPSYSGCRSGAGLDSCGGLWARIYFNSIDQNVTSSVSRLCDVIAGDIYSWPAVDIDERVVQSIDRCSYKGTSGDYRISVDVDDRGHELRIFLKFYSP